MGCVSSFPSPILLGYLWQGNISQEGISLHLLQTAQLQVVKRVLCYFQGVGMGEVSVSSSFHLSHFIPSVGSSSVQGPCSSKQVCRAVPCSPLYSKKQANPYLKIITVTFSWMRVPAVYKGRKGKAFQYIPRVSPILTPLHFGTHPADVQLEKGCPSGRITRLGSSAQHYSFFQEQKGAPKHHGFLSQLHSLEMSLRRSKSSPFTWAGVSISHLHIDTCNPMILWKHLKVTVNSK